MQFWGMSFLEAITNIVAGYGLAVTIQLLVFPLFGLAVSLGQNLVLGAVFTVVSLVRSFVLRRPFNHLVRRAGP